MARFPGQAGSLAATPMSPARLETTLMARVLASLFAAGATLAMSTVALPHAPDANTAGLLLIVAAAYLTAAVLADLWRAIDAACDAELAEAKLSVQDFLKSS